MLAVTAASISAADALQRCALPAASVSDTHKRCGSECDQRVRRDSRYKFECAHVGVRLLLTSDGSRRARVGWRSCDAVIKSGLSHTCIGAIEPFVSFRPGDKNSGSCQADGDTPSMMRAVASLGMMRACCNSRRCFKRSIPTPLPSRRASSPAVSR